MKNVVEKINITTDVTRQKTLVTCTRPLRPTAEKTEKHYARMSNLHRKNEFDLSVNRITVHRKRFGWMTVIVHNTGEYWRTPTAGARNYLLTVRIDLRSALDHYRVMKRVFFFNV